MNEPERPIDGQPADRNTKENIVAADSAIERHPAEISPNRRRIGLVSALILLIVIVFLLAWYFVRSSSEAGKPVPAPRSPVADVPSETLPNQTLTLSTEQVQNAGLTFVTVGEQLSSKSTETSATGTVEANAYRQTPAVALVGGVIRRVIPELGERVLSGQTVAVIFSDEFAQTQSRYIALRTEAENARRNYERAQRLVAINQPGRSEFEQAARQRKAAEAALSEMQNRYLRTARLVTIGAASREEFEQDNTKLKTAEAELEEARLRETRATTLLPIGSEVRAASEEALNKLRTSESELAAVGQRLVLFGMLPGRVQGLRSVSQVTSELAVPAPVSGTVTARSTNVGEVVEANKELIRVTDLSSVWVIAQVFEQDLARLRVGSGATVTSDAFPTSLFRGHVTYIDPQLDETTRSAKIRVELDNPGGQLKLGMYVRVAFGSLGTAERTVPIVPSGVIQNINGQSVVFIASADPNVFELRPVRLGPESNGQYQVLEGLNVGDRAVLSGSFALRAEWLKTNQSNGHQH